MDNNEKNYWFFDFASPYSYLVWQKIIKEDIDVTPKPVMVGAVISHFGGVGPGAIKSKREYLFADCLRRAKKMGVKLRTPAKMPFSPLPILRIAISLNDNVMMQRVFISYAFQYGWQEGLDYEDYDGFKSYICLKLGLSSEDYDNLLESRDSRKLLKQNIKESVELGIFGVPTFYNIDSKKIFWGLDSVDFYLEDLIGNDPLTDLKDEFKRFVEITGEMD